MKNEHFYNAQNQKPAGAAHLASAGELSHNKTDFNMAAAVAHPEDGGALNHNKMDFPPWGEAVAARAYFSYVNEGYPQGQDLRHWLDAEAELHRERTLTRTHGYPKHH